MNLVPRTRGQHIDQGSCLEQTVKHVYFEKICIARHTEAVQARLSKSKLGVFQNIGNAFNLEGSHILTGKSRRG
jgi:hypothetical protein